METSAVLTEEAVNAIATFINKKKTDDRLLDRFPNAVLRDDVLEILELYCTVVFFPFEQDHNNGFNITGIPDRNGLERQFVFINTAQSIEKQVFTAAHELGHVWEVDSIIAKETSINLDSISRECIINRFAAELLMPKENFRRITYAEFEKYKDEKNGMTLLSFLKLVASLMNYFLAPEKAVIRRLGEIEALDSRTVDMLTDDSSDVNGVSIRKIVTETIRQIIQSNGYTDLQKGSKRKAIKGLQDLLEEAEKKQSITQSKIESLRKVFGISEPKNTDKLDEKIDFFK